MSHFHFNGNNEHTIDTDFHLDKVKKYTLAIGESETKDKVRQIGVREGSKA